MQSISGLTSVELQIDIRKSFFFARIVSNDDMSPVVREIFRFGAKEYFRNPDCVLARFRGDIVGLLKKYDLHSYFIGLCFIVVCSGTSCAFLSSASMIHVKSYPRTSYGLC